MSDEDERVFLCIGSNLGDRLRYLQAAVKGLEDESKIEVVEVSTAYESAAMYMDTEAPAFLNAAIEIKTALNPHELLEVTQSIEKQLGRQDRDQTAYESRVIDIDIVLFGERIIATPQLTLPHKGLNNRPFFLQPLADLDPDLRVPDTDRTVSERAKELAHEQPLSPVAAPEEWVSADL